MNDMTRRDVAKMTAAGVAGLGVLGAASAFAQESSDARGSSVSTSPASSSIATQWSEAVQEAVESRAHRAFRGTKAGPQELFGTGFCYRHDWGDWHGQNVLRLNWGAINSTSCVFVAIGEGAAGGPNGGKFIGASRFTLHNVAPRAGGVDIWINIEWSTPIRLYADYLVINP